MATTTVFCIFAFTTVPTCSPRCPPAAPFAAAAALPVSVAARFGDRPLDGSFSLFRAMSLPARRGRSLGAPLPEDRLHPRDVPPGLTDLQGVVELSDRLLEAQLEELLPQLALLRRQLVGAHLPDLVWPHDAT